MSLAEVAKINLIIHKKDQAQVLEALQNIGLAQIDEYQGEDLAKENLNEQIAEFDYQLAGIKFSLDFLLPYDDAKKSLSEKVNPKIDLTSAELERIIADFDHQQIVKQVQEVESKINKAQNTIEKSRLEINQLTPWQRLDFIPNKETFSTNFSFELIETTEKNYPQLLTALQKKLRLSEIQRINHGEKEIRSIIVYPKKQESDLFEILTELNIKTVEIPNLNVEVKDHIKNLNRLIDTSESKIGKFKQEAEKLTQHIQNLKIIYDYFGWEKDRLVYQQKAGNSQKTISLTGWLDKELIEPLKKQLARITDNFIVEELPIKKEDESVPVIFKNKLAQDFESITGLYGVPQRHEPDPTPFLAPFFILFFGMAMTDAGYGLIMALGILAAIKFFKIPRKKQKLLRVLMWGGVMTFILGALTGGWFSIELTILPAIIATPLKQIQLLDPVKNPLFIFYLSLGLGVTQVLTGLAINTFWKIKSKQALDGLFGSGAWFLTIVSILIFSGGTMGMLPAIFSQIGKWLTVLGVLLIIFNGTRGTKNLFLKPGLGILSLYNAVGYFSDVLSYSRLLALGLTTTIIGTVVNIIAGLVFGIPYVGWFAALIVLIGGHIFNLAINALGAFIHSARLQFIEFFPKFLEAGGQPFEPFQKEAKYIKLIN